MLLGKIFAMVAQIAADFLAMDVHIGDNGSHGETHGPLRVQEQQMLQAIQVNSSIGHLFERDQTFVDQLRTRERHKCLIRLSHDPNLGNIDQVWLAGPGVGEDSPPQCVLSESMTYELA